MSAAQFLTGNPLCRPRTDGSGLWDFKEPVGFRNAAGKEWWTCANLVSDGASIPKPLRWMYGNPFSSNFIRPAALHDYYYQVWAPRFAHSDRLSQMARLAVDRMFLDALLCDGVHPVKAYTMYLGVRSGGWVAWNNHIRRATAPVTQ